MKFHITEVSLNKKLGAMSCSSSSRDTCPPSCSLKQLMLPDGSEREGPCYANGFHTAMHWDQVDNGKRGVNFTSFIEKLSLMIPVPRFRGQQVGDLPGKDNKLDKEKCIKYADTVRRHRHPFTYTHYPVTPRAALDEEVEYNGVAYRLKLPKVGAALAAWNKAIISRMMRNYTVNVSCDSLNQVDEAVALGLPAVVAVPRGTPKVSSTPEGVRCVQCPATWDKDTNCANCGGTKGPLCWRKDRDYAITFPAHGTWRRLTEKILTAVSKGEE